LELQNPADGSHSVYNTAVGFEAGSNISTGHGHTLMGGRAGDAITTSTSNTAIGRAALKAETTGSSNTAIGRDALIVQNGGANNAALGFQAGLAVTTGNNNTLIGSNAGDVITSGSNNICIGLNAAISAHDVNNQTVIGVATTVKDALVHGLKQPVTSANAAIAAANTTPNTIYVFGDADGAIVTLPDSGNGSQIGKTYEFVVTVTATSNAHKVVFTDTTNEKIYGQLNTIDSDTSDTQVTFLAQAGDSFSAISLNGTTTGIIGSRFKLTNVAADIWFAEGNIHHTGNVATPFATS